MGPHSDIRKISHQPEPCFSISWGTGQIKSVGPEWHIDHSPFSRSKPGMPSTLTVELLYDPSAVLGCHPTCYPSPHSWAVCVAQSNGSGQRDLLSGHSYNRGHSGENQGHCHPWNRRVSLDILFQTSMQDGTNIPYNPAIPLQGMYQQKHEYQEWWGQHVENNHN